MRLPLSWLGSLLATMYLVIAVWFIYTELRASGGEINLRGLGIALATLPSQWTFGLLFDALGWRVNPSELGPSGTLQIAFHVLATAVFFYGIGFGIEWLVRRLVQST